jgi:lysophospholipase L1-like esterase
MALDPVRGGTSATPKPSSLTRLLLVGFATHLLLPLGLVIDSVWLSTKRPLSPLEQCVVFGGIVWLISCGFLLAASRYREHLQARLTRITVLFYSILVPFSVVEMVLEVRYGQDPGPTFYSPETRFRTNPDPTLTPGVRGTAISEINELGLRGASIRILAGRANVFKIFTLGGSATICAYLDDTEAWPNLLMEGLNHRQDRYFVFVGNAGARAHASLEHLEFLRRMPVLRSGDLLIFLVGVNDLERTLNFGGGSLKQFFNEAIEQLRHKLTPVDLPAYKRLRLFQRARNILLSLDSETGANDTNAHVGRQRRVRAQSQVVPLPDLSIGLSEYREHIQAIVDYCRSSGQRCLFLTQPTLWRDDLTESEQGLLWFGRTAPSGGHGRGYVAPAELAKAMDRFNRALIEVCTQAGVEVYDLAAAVPRDTSIFYDDCHFNENGSRVVAQLLVDWLAHRPPFDESQR